MVQIKKVNSVSDEIALECANADLARANSLIEYLSMMADIEIPTEEEPVATEVE